MDCGRRNDMPQPRSARAAVQAAADPLGKRADPPDRVPRRADADATPAAQKRGLVARHVRFAAQSSFDIGPRAR